MVFPITLYRVSFRRAHALTAVTALFVSALMVLNINATTASAHGCIATPITPTCGTIYNKTNHFVKVCLNWIGRDDGDQAYQSRVCDPKQIAYARPYSIYGWPQRKDIDAFYIPPGTSYWGFYSILPGGLAPNLGFPVPKRWTHTKSGWWKFSTLTTVHVNWTS